MTSLDIPPRIKHDKHSRVIALCADPANLQSARLMHQHLDAAGGRVELITDYEARMRDVRAHGTRKEAKRYSAIILMGNDAYDVGPHRYNIRYAKKDRRHNTEHPQTKSEIDGPPNVQARARYETHMAHEALLNGIPLVGICGGMQRINVECGEEKGRGTGTLIQHLPDMVGHNNHAQEANGHPSQAATQKIHVEGGSKFSGLLHASQLPDTEQAIVDLDSAPPADIMVCTRHHQAVETLGTGLKVTGYATDIHPQSGENIQVVKAIESDPNGPYRKQFIIGMQFHPEMVQDHPLAPALAERIVREARRYEKTHHSHRTPAADWHR